jgi:RND superfamily putative drug exporter
LALKGYKETLAKAKEHNGLKIFEAIGRFSVRFRWLIIILWIAAIPILTSTLPKLNDVSKNDNSQFLPKDSQTQKAADLESAFQSKDTTSRTDLVVLRQDGKLSKKDLAAVNAIVENIKKVDGVLEIRQLGVSKDGQAAEYSIGLGEKAAGTEAPDVASDIRGQMKTDIEGLQLHLAGEFAQAVDQQNSNSSTSSKTELFNIIFIIVLLLIVFRALLAPIVTLLPAIFALMVAQPIIAESTKIGVQVSFLTEILLIVLLIGAGTDYGLFLVFRTREELRNGLRPKEAVIKAVSRVGESITFSAATVAGALMCLALASFGIYRGLGPALAIGLAVMLLAALTLLPAILSLLGRAVFWPSKTEHKVRIGLWGRVADRVIKKPVVMLVAGTALLVALSFGVVGYKTGGFSNGEPVAGSDSAAGAKILQEHFPAANQNPQLVIMRFSDSAWNTLDRVYAAQKSLESSPAFKAISGPFNINGNNLSPQQLGNLYQTDPDNDLIKAEGQFISADGKTVQFNSIANTNALSGSRTSAQKTPEVLAAADQAAKAAGAEASQVYGQDAATYDISRIANNDLKRIIPVVLLVIAILLAILLRSLVAPWYLIASVLLSYLAALGFAMIVFVHIGGADGLNFILPFLMFVFAMALGEDYNILVMSRIREETHHAPTLKQAVAKAIGVTGTTVTSAGIILAGTFTVFALVSGDEQFHQIGFSIAFGILLDTFFVRTLLVPSIVVLLGKWNWWPSQLSKANQ